jgi:hypothetical protein
MSVRRSPLFRLTPLAAPAALVLAACALGGGSRSQDTGYGTEASSFDLRACHDEVLRRYGDVRPADVSVQRAGNESGYSTRVNWRTRSGGAGSCMVATDGTIVGFREDRSPYTDEYGNTGDYGANGGYGNTGGDNGAPADLVASQIEACRAEVTRRVSGTMPQDVSLTMCERDEKNTASISWRTVQGASGTCLVNYRSTILAFDQDNR